MKNSIMTCKDCKFFSPFTAISIDGACNSGKLLNGYDDGKATSDCAQGGGYDGYGDYIHVGRDFGCIHYQMAQHVIGTNI